MGLKITLVHNLFVITIKFVYDNYEYSLTYNKETGQYNLVSLLPNPLGTYQAKNKILSEIMDKVKYTK